MATHRRSSGSTFTGSTLRRGHYLEKQSKEIVCNVYDYFMKMHQKGQSAGPFKRTAEAKKVTKNTLKKVLRKRERGFEPAQKRYKVSRKAIIVVLIVMQSDVKYMRCTKGKNTLH